MHIDATVRPDEVKRPVIERHRHPRSGDTLVTLLKDSQPLAGDLGLGGLTATVMPKGRNFR